MKRGPGRQKGDGGKRAQIIEEKWSEIYALYRQRVPVVDIIKKLDLHVKESVVYDVLNKMRAEQREHLNKMMNADTDDTLARYKALQEELELWLFETKDKEFGLKVVKELRSMYEFQLNLKAVAQGTVVSPDYGKDDFQKEVAKLIKANETMKLGTNTIS